MNRRYGRSTITNCKSNAFRTATAAVARGEDDGTQVLFSIRDTRVEDFGAFVDNSGYDATGGMRSLGMDGNKTRGATWKEPEFKQGPAYLVVGVSWDDAKRFANG